MKLELVAVTFAFTCLVVAVVAALVIQAGMVGLTARLF